MRFSFRPLLVVFALAVAGCSGDPELYDLDDPTPNKLRGVFKTVVEEPGMNIEIRLRFDDDKLAGAITCTPTSSNVGALSATGEVELSTDALDEAVGKFRVPTLAMVKTSEKYICEGGLKGAEYEFKVEELRLTMRIPNEKFEIIYAKIGD